MNCMFKTIILSTFLVFPMPTYTNTHEDAIETFYRGSLGVCIVAGTLFGSIKLMEYYNNKSMDSLPVDDLVIMYEAEMKICQSYLNDYQAYYLHKEDLETLIKNHFSSANQPATTYSSYLLSSIGELESYKDHFQHKKTKTSDLQLQKTLDTYLHNLHMTRFKLVECLHLIVHSKMYANERKQYYLERAAYAFLGGLAGYFLHDYIDYCSKN